jgi:hypothetical protein
MQPNKTKLAIQIGTVLLGASYASIVTADSFDAKITTIQDVTVTPVQTLDFGENITTGALGVCTMTANSASNANMRYDNTTEAATFAALAGDARYGALSGNGCVTGAVAQPGIWSIDGGLGLGVTVNFVQQAPDSGDFTFEPDNGCIMDYDGGTTANADVCDVISNANYAGTTTGLTLAAADALENNGGTGLAEEGKLYFTMGGTITIGAAGLTQNLDHVIKFGVNVTY